MRYRNVSNLETTHKMCNKKLFYMDCEAKN